MSSIIRASSKALLLVGLMLTGCAGDGSDNIFTTGALGTSSSSAAAAPAPEASRVDPVCVSLAARIDGLRREGVADKIEKAAVKKYTLTKADLAKADQLTKVNAEYQQRCGSVPPSTTASTPPMPPASKPAAKAKAAAAVPAPN